VKKALLYVLILLVIQSCNRGFKGKTSGNQAPETHVVADTIVRSGDNRFISQVKITWWGDDKDGYIKGYEFSFNGSQWIFTTKQDSLFTLQLPAGSDSADFKFQVRAIDNQDLRDPTPATLIYPLKNSPPSASVFIPAGTAQFPSKNTLRTYPAFKLFWTGTDPDGDDNLDHFELYLNDTNGIAYTVPPAITQAAFVAKDILTNNPDCDVYSSTNQKLQSSIKGLKLNDYNVLYVRAVDKVGARSAFAASYSFYCKKPVNKLLVVNASYPFTPLKLNFFHTGMSNAGLGVYDTLNAFRINNNNFDELSPDFFTQNKALKFFDKMVWFSENDSVSLALAQRSLGDFLANNGRIFMMVNFSQYFYENSNLLDFTPVKELIPDTQGIFRMNVNAQMIPLISGYPVLKAGSIISSARPFLKAIDNGNNSFVDVYNGELLVSTPNGPLSWTGPSVVCAKRENAITHQANFIFTSMPLDKMNANNNIDSLFRKAMVEELGF
jgi:hypothetical protein